MHLEINWDIYLPLVDVIVGPLYFIYKTDLGLSELVKLAFWHNDQS